MKTTRVMLCGLLCLPLGALFFSKAWSAPTANDSSATIPQTFTAPMEISLRVKASADEYDEEPILWIDERADTSKIQHYATVSSFARINNKAFGTQNTGNLKVRWHSTGGLFLLDSDEKPSQHVITTQSDISGKGEIRCGTKQPGKYTIYAEVLTPEGKIYATSEPVQIEAKIVGDKVEIVYGNWTLVEGDDNLYSRKIWAYYLRDNVDIIQNRFTSIPNTPLNLTVELYNGSPVSQKVSWLDKTQVVTPINSEIRSFPSQEDQPMATQFFRYNPIAEGPHDLDAYFVKGVKR